MSREAAQLVAKSIPPGKPCLISFPAGDTPKGMVEEFVRMVNGGDLDISHTRYVSLDEWVGLGRRQRGSCAWFNHTHILDRLEKPFLEYHLIDGEASDMAKECQRLDTFIAQHGPLDLSVLGIGMNGHLGFNEEGVDFSLNAHVIPLSRTTRSVMGKYFDTEYDLKFGITQGLAQIMAAQKVILIASGPHKADILWKAFRGPVSNRVPASILQRHPNCVLVVDAEAGSRLFSYC